MSSTRSSDDKPSSSIVVPGPTARPPAYCASSASTDAPEPVCVGGAPVATQSLISRRFSLRVPSVRGSSGPGHTETPRIFCGSGRCWFACRTTSSAFAPGSSTSTACTRSLRALPRSHHGGVPHAGHDRNRALHVLGKHVQPVGRDDHLLLAPADEQPSLRVHLADVARPEPSVLERVCGRTIRVEVALRHVLPANEDLAVGCNLHLDTGNRLADRSAAGAEGVIERDDGRGFGEAVALHDHEAEPAPEFFE